MDGLPPHIDGRASDVIDLLLRYSQLHERLDVKSDAIVAAVGGRRSRFPRPYKFARFRGHGASRIPASASLPNADVSSGCICFIFCIPLAMVAISVPDAGGLAFISFHSP
ncbi:hypothetical protein [Paraburkholderia lycopersici]|uniref:hypothetical protein n=1 Tax=Paraburkholderia lycopersici TaxID=416944 RepID=UPI001FE211D9|nr:hypothetical protein [Paraburkholderia lycopersici]